MKNNFFILFIFLNTISGIVTSQVPDLSKIKSDKEKVKAWLVYCSVLRLNKNGAKDNYIVLQHAGLKGLQLVKNDDYEDKASFCLYTALGYYYQIKLDSAQYYFPFSKKTKLLCGQAVGHFHDTDGLDRGHCLCGHQLCNRSAG